MNWLRHLLAVVVLSAAALACMHRLVAEPSGIIVGPQNGGRNDLTAFFIPWRSFLKIGWTESGHPPMWNPYGLGGIPWLGNPQSAMFYPPNWLYLITTATWLPGWMMVGHLIFGGLGAYSLGNWWKWNWGVSVLVGCAFLSAPFLIAHLAEGHYNQICVTAWLPWGLLGFLRMREGRRLSVPILAGIFSLAFFAGHVQELYYLILTLSFWVLCDVLLPSAWRGEQSPLKLFGNWALTGCVLIGIVAVELGPIYNYTRQAVRASGVDLQSAAGLSIGLESLWQLWNPFVHGGPTDYHGPGVLYWESVLHFGVLLTGLALLSPIVRFRDPMVRRLFVTLVISLVFVAGTRTPLFMIFFKYVPGIAMFRGPARLLFWVSLLVCLLGGFTLQTFVERLTKKPSIGRLLAVGLIGLVYLVVMTENIRHANAVTRVIPNQDFRSDSEIALFLRDKIGFEGNDDSRVIVDQNLLSDREAWNHGIGKVHAYDPVPLMRAALLIDVLNPLHPPNEELVGLLPTYPARYRSNILDLLAVRYAVVPAGGPSVPEGWELRKRGTVRPETVLAGSSASLLAYEIWENTDALPRAFVLGNTELVTGESVSDLLAKVQPRRHVIVAKDVLSAAESRQPFTPAQIEELTPDSLTIRAKLDAPGYLIVSDLISPGWKATVDGQPTPLIPVNVVHRGVALGPGEHTVEMWYTPPGFKFWGIVSVTTICVLIVMTLQTMRAGRETIIRRDPTA
ncbi:glycosyltransferase family protein [Thalassoroseus pseudoceratinae]|uniref:YfhO family protein n=1 Tax=Thalassoroseus pseudoceratinae TaxID=2713176 RepID=UPI001423A471|nr:YfhO family protein [Thalassoroseus pseudoceratinae]